MATTGNPPATIWRATSGNNDSVSYGPDFIVDTAGNLLVDPQGNFVIDTGITMPLIPATIWEEDDSI